MDLTILAQTTETTEPDIEVAAQIIPIDVFWEQIESLSLFEALTFIAFGAVCLMYGWRIFKSLVVMSFGLVGMFLGKITTGLGHLAQIPRIGQDVDHTLDGPGGAGQLSRLPLFFLDLGQFPLDFPVYIRPLVFLGLVLVRGHVNVEDEAHSPRNRDPHDPPVKVIAIQHGEPVHPRQVHHHEDVLRKRVHEL